MDLEAKFWEFHRANPHVYMLLRRFTWEIKQAGHKHYSMDAVYHRVRWHMQIDTIGDLDFKLNNNHTSYYARMIMRREPALEGFFRTRELRGE